MKDKRPPENPSPLELLLPDLDAIAEQKNSNDPRLAEIHTAVERGDYALAAKLIIQLNSDSSTPSDNKVHVVEIQSTIEIKHTHTARQDKRKAIRKSMA